MPKHDIPRLNSSISTLGIPEEERGAAVKGAKWGGWRGRFVKKLASVKKMIVGNNTGCKPACPPKSVFERKIAQLQEQKRPYVQKTQMDVNKAHPVTATIEHLSPDDPVILSYMSKGKQESLNCNARSFKNGQQIVCRHLAYAYATGRFGTKETGKYADIDTPEKLAAHQDIPDDEELELAKDRVSQSGYYFDRQGLGKALCTALKNQKSANKQSECYLLHSHKHTMALKVKWEPENDTVKLAFYDPNDTLRVRRLLVRSSADLEWLTIDDFVGNPDWLNVYFLEENFAGVLQSIDKESGSKHTSAEVFAASLNPVMTNLLMHHGHFANTGIQDWFAREVAEATTTRKKELLGNPANEGFSPLFNAMQNGHAQCVESWLNYLEGSGFSKADKKALLGHTSNEGASPLFMAMQNDHAECVEGWLNYLEGSGLSDTDKKELLGQTSNQGVSSFCIAMYMGNAECVKELLKYLKGSGLSKADKKELLGGTSPDFSPLFLAMKNDHAQCVDSWLKYLDGSELSKGDKKELLGRAANNGTSPLFIAMENGNTSCIELFMNTVIESSLLWTFKVGLIRSSCEGKAILQRSDELPDMA